MPTISQTPSVTVSVPVPTPVQQPPKKPRGPVSFGGETPPQQPVQPVQQPQQAPAAAIPPMRRQLAGVILPWSPPPKGQAQQMKRLPSKVVKYAAAINIASHGETPHQALTRFLGGRNQRRHGRSVTVFRTDNGDIAVRLYNTNVVTAHPNGQVTLNHGGYMSPTTRRFMGYANPVIRNVSFAGGKFSILGPNGWEEYENNTPYPPQHDNANEPVPERGVLTPEQVTMLNQGILNHDMNAFGVLGDHLTESGYPHTGSLLARFPHGDPGVSVQVLHAPNSHHSFREQEYMGENEFRFVPGKGKHDLHELHVQLPNGNRLYAIGSKPAPEKLSRTRSSSQEQYGRVKKVVKFSTHSHELAALLKNARQNPYDNTLHGVIADKLEELMPNSPLPELIRKQYGLGQYGGQGEQDVMYHEPFYNSWDGSFPYFARLGRHGPFSLYLGHEGTPEVQGSNQRWILHVISDMKGSRDSGYTFEFPHEEAHLIPRMFREAASYIHPQTHGLVQRGKEWVKGPPHDENYRNQEAESFDDRMREEEENRTD